MLTEKGPQSRISESLKNLQKLASTVFTRWYGIAKSSNASSSSKNETSSSHQTTSQNNISNAVKENKIKQPSFRSDSSMFSELSMGDSVKKKKDKKKRKRKQLEAEQSPQQTNSDPSSTENSPLQENSKEPMLPSPNYLTKRSKTEMKPSPEYELGMGIKFICSFYEIIPWLQFFFGFF